MLSALFAAECPISLVRELRDADPRSVPARLWKSLADAGVFGLFLPQEYGGAGGALSDLGIFCLDPNSNRNLLDFISETVDPTTGFAHIAYADDNTVNKLRVANQTAGTCVIGKNHAAITASVSIVAGLTGPSSALVWRRRWVRSRMQGIE